MVLELRDKIGALPGAGGAAAATTASPGGRLA